jgi:hypothetical protein
MTLGPQLSIGLIQPFDPKDHSATIATIDDVTAVVPDCGARRAWQTHTLASSSDNQKIRLSPFLHSVLSYSVSVIRPIAECSMKPSSGW